MIYRVLTALVTSVAILAGLSACSSSNGIQSTYDYNRQIDFRDYKTYAFISENPMVVSQTETAINPMLEGRIMESIRITMNGKGYNEVSDPESASMAIGFTVGSRDQIKVDSYPSSFATGYSRAGYYYGYNTGTETRVRQYTEGQLAVDIFDVSSHTPAFHGVASKKLSDSDRQNQQEVLNAVAAEALSGFPLRGGTVMSDQ